MNSADLLWIGLLIAALCLVTWIAYKAGQTAGRAEALHTISKLRGHLRAQSQRLERTSYELTSLRQVLKDQRLRGVVEPEWMNQDG